MALLIGATYTILSARVYQKVCVGWGFGEVLSTYMGVEGPQSFGFSQLGETKEILDLYKWKA